MTLAERARSLREYIEKAAAFLSDKDALNAAELFPNWSADGVVYSVGTRVRYGRELFKCLTEHTSQPSWTPFESPSLWVKIDDPREDWPAWRQPVGATDAYIKGYQVSHVGKYWVSEIDGNVWEPGVYGWKEVIPMS